MKKVKMLLITCAFLVSVTSCFEDLDDNIVLNSTLEINDFVWKGMNAVYLYKSDIPNLADNRFSSNEEYTDYLNGFEAPEPLFESLKYLPETVDRFSRIYDNYFDLQNAQQGTSLSNGLEFNLYFVPGSDTQVYGAITLVLNNSVADTEGLVRGQIFRGVNGTELTEANFVDLLSQDAYTLNFADYDTNGTPDRSDDTVTINGENAMLTKATYTENPVHRTEVLTVGTTKIGYLMYNGFNANFNSQLNTAFAELKAANVTELVIDLRYNGGGAVQTAAYMGSMVTGQFNGSVYSKLFYNETLEANNTNFLFTNTIEGVGAINSLNLSKVYVLTTNRRTASASELVINSLKPYIDVVVIGENTVGKTQASITIYDSENLQFENVNPAHTYAMQPLIANSANVNNELVPANGLTPDVQLTEVSFNLGILGDVDEPLLAAAIAEITGLGRSPVFQTGESVQPIGINKSSHPLDEELYID
ncbi:MAG: S41 family peptidase [Winogradskyella sp.]|nr:S41 family peptidase [Winogradskyella sp.]